MPDAAAPTAAQKSAQPVKTVAPQTEVGMPGVETYVPRNAAHVLMLQRLAGNTATQRMVQRAELDNGTSVLARQPTPVNLSLLKVKDYLGVAIEGVIEETDPTADPKAPGAAGSFGDHGHTFKLGAIEFSASLLKVNNPLDESINEWLGIGEQVKVASSLAMFKIAADTSMKDLRNVDAGMNVGEIEVSLSGTFNDSTMQTSWGQKFFGGSALGKAMTQKRAKFVGSIKLSIALPVEDALRLAQVATYHKQLRAMSAQNANWIAKIRGLKFNIKELDLAWRTTKDAIERMSIARKYGEVRNLLKKYGRDVAKNKKLARKLLTMATQAAKAMATAFKATLAKFIPILNAYFLITDTIKAIEVIYGLISGKGYSFAWGGDDGGSGEGDEPGGGGESEDGEFAGVENQAAGGGDKYSKPAELNPNAMQIYTLLLQNTNGELGNADMDQLNSIVSADLSAEQMQNLIAALQKAKLANSPFKALAQIMGFTRQVREASEKKGQGEGEGTGNNASGEQGTAAAAGQGGGQSQDGTGGANEEETPQLNNDQSYEQTQAQSSEKDQVDLNANETTPDTPNPAKTGGETSQIPQVDPDIRAFMVRAMAAIESGKAGYAEFDDAQSYNNLNVGDVFRGKVAVVIPTQVKNSEGQTSTQNIWYGGEAQIKVLGKLAGGQLDVLRSVMQGYNRYGRFVGTVAAARMTVGYVGELAGG